MKPHLLAIDTAFERCSAAVLDMRDGRVLARDEPLIGKGHAERLMDVVAGVLAGAEASYATLGRIAVTVGPGSFTGLRVGVSAARGLALALAVPAVGVTTLEALARPHLGALPEGLVLAVLDARRGEVYAALYVADGICHLEPRALAPDALAAWLRPRLAGGRLLGLVGSGAAIAAEALAPAAAATILSVENHIDAGVVAAIAAAREPGAAPRPLYLRGADAKPPSPAAGPLSFAEESPPQATP